MKKILRILLAVGFLLIILIGKNFFDNKYKEESKSNYIKEEVVKKDNDETTKVENNSSIKNNEEENEKIDDNYITIDKSLVRIPILMYHSVSDSDSNNSLLVPVNQFKEEIKWLKENGFTPMLLEDVVKAFDTGYVPKKPVAITFDDGYADNYTDAYRILKENNMKATFFIITNNTDVDSFYMNSSMLKEMNENGMGIENHTSRHIEFPNISRDDKIAIIEEGKSVLKEKVGVDSKFVCYPVGKYDSETIEIQKELGIEAAVTTEPGISSSSDGMYTLKRLRISPMDIETFKTFFIEFM